MTTTIFGIDANLLFNILTLILGGGALATILRYHQQLKALALQQHTSDREADRVDFGTVLAEVKAQRDEAKTRIEAQDNRINSMEAEIQGLRLARDLDPFPHWIVDRSGEYLYVNREFERYFLEPQGMSYRDAVGRKHEDLGWPAEFCEKLKTLDALARTRPDGKARAVASLTVAELGSCQVTVHKIPVRFKPAGVIVAYAGYITDMEPETMMIAAGSNS